MVVKINPCATMNYKDQLQALRRRVPIPIHEAISRLKANQGNVDAVEQEFIEQCIAKICEQTNASRDLAFTRFKEQKYDLAKAISSIREEEYDLNYTQPSGLTKEKLTLVEKWLIIRGEEGLGTALGYHLHSVIETLSLMPVLSDLVESLKSLEKLRQKVLEPYQDIDDRESRLKSSNKFRTSVEYQQCVNLLDQKIHLLERELARHARNIQ
jgi:hypothetical protein